MSYRLVPIQDETATKFQQYLVSLTDADTIDKLTEILYNAFLEKSLDIWLYARLHDYAAHRARLIENRDYFDRYYGKGK